MDGAHIYQMFLQRFDNGLWQYRYPVFVSLASPYHELAHFKINILHAKSQAFKQAQSRSIKQVAGNPVLSIQLAQYLSNLVRGKYRWQSSRLFSALNCIQLRHREFQGIPVKKQQSTECLVLGRSRDLAFNSQAGQKRLNLGFAQFSWVAPVMKSNKPSNPLNIGLFCSMAVMFKADALPDDFQQHGFF